MSYLQKARDWEAREKLRCIVAEIIEAEIAEPEKVRRLLCEQGWLSVQHRTAGVVILTQDSKVAIPLRWQKNW